MEGNNKHKNRKWKAYRYEVTLEGQFELVKVQVMSPSRLMSYKALRLPSIQRVAKRMREHANAFSWRHASLESSVKELDWVMEGEMECGHYTRIEQEVNALLRYLEVTQDGVRMLEAEI